MQIKITNAKDTVIQNFKGVDLEIARSNSSAYITKLRVLSKPHQRSIDNGTISIDDDIAITAESLAGTVLVGWSNFNIGKDKIEYSVSNAAKLLIADPDCRRFVLDISKDEDLFEIPQDDKTKEK